jgi:Glyoxalase-like domain
MAGFWDEAMDWTLHEVTDDHAGVKAAEVARLRTLGATDLDLGRGHVPWTCLADPEGHEFCVLAQS